MDEAGFWARLEYRVCREFAGMSDNRLRFLWCDGFIPEQYLLNEQKPRIVGQAWICNGSRQDAWTFTLFLPHPVRSREEIEWAALLPAENVTRWLAFDQPGKSVQMEPSAAAPDLT